MLDIITIIKPYTNDSTEWKGKEIGFESQYSSSGVYVTIYGIDKADQDDFKKHLKSERDVIAIKFK